MHSMNEDLEKVVCGHNDCLESFKAVHADLVLKHLTFMFMYKELLGVVEWISELNSNLFSLGPVTGGQVSGSEGCDKIERYGTIKKRCTNG